VLVLEAGHVYRSVEEMPDELLLPTSIAAAAPGHPNNWAYLAEMRPGFKVPYARGKGLGGSSSINGCYFIRGTEGDFDTWGRLGNAEWTYEKVLPYYKRSESDQDFADEYHGGDGPIPVKREPMERAREFTTRFEAACRELGFPGDPDKNAPSEGGVGPVPMNIADGRRAGTALRYLLPALDRPNFEIVGNAEVQRVIIQGKKAVGVEAVVAGIPTKLYANEIVLSAGALRSPQLLMLSGIGPADHLTGHGIEVVEDLSGVGQNLTDHAMIMASWDSRVDLPKRLDQGALTSVLHWQDEGSPLEILPFVTRSGDMMSTANVLERPAKAIGAMRGVSVRAVARQMQAMRHALLAISVMHEDSRGSVSLASPNPTDMPVLRWNLLAADVDRVRFRAAVRLADAIFRSEPMQEIGAKIVGLSKKVVRRDREIDGWVEGLITGGHPSCTCKMGPSSDPSAVVDQYLRVHGVESLRVADTSVFPTMPSRGPNATAIMIGDRLADFIAGSGRAAAESRKVTQVA
jgi:choline dehydrogenase